MGKLRPGALSDWPRETEHVGLLVPKPLFSSLHRDCSPDISVWALGRRATLLSLRKASLL